MEGTQEQTETVFQGRRVVRVGGAGARGTLVWFHGGGWAIALGDDAVAWGRDLAAATGLAVLLPDYPIAPYPVPNAWCADFWRHCAQALPAPCFLGGDSAGAHLALCALPAAPLPTRAAFVYAVTTLLPTRDAGSWHAYRRDWPLSPRLMDYFLDRYCPDLETRLAASPLHQLDRLPPTLLRTAQDDILADQQTDLARRLGAEQIVYPAARHIFLSRPEGAPFRARALADLAAWFAHPNARHAP